MIWKRDRTSLVSFDNWMKDFNMDCASTVLISSFGMAFFAAYAIGNIVLPPLADSHGRKNVFVISLLVSWV